MSSCSSVPGARRGRAGEFPGADTEGFGDPRLAEGGLCRGEHVAEETAEVGEGGERAGDAAGAAEEAGGEVVRGALEVGAGFLVVFGGGAAGDRVRRERAEAGLGHAEGFPDAACGPAVEGFPTEVLGQVTEDQGGPIRVLDGFAGRAVESFLEDAVANVLWVGAVEVFEVGAERQTGRVGQELVGGHLGERVAGDLGPESAERGVELELALFDEGADDGSHGDDLGEAGDVEDGVEPHRLVGGGRVEETDRPAHRRTGGVADGPDGSRIDPVADGVREELCPRRAPLGRRTRRTDLPDPHARVDAQRPDRGEHERPLAVEADFADGRGDLDEQTEAADRGASEE
jgi:hypothetical protein